jgi:hypothetical protein
MVSTTKQYMVWSEVGHSRFIIQLAVHSIFSVLKLLSHIEEVYSLFNHLFKIVFSYLKTSLRREKNGITNTTKYMLRFYILGHEG